MENMNWTNLLMHQTLNKVPQNEARKDIRKTKSAYLSELGSTGIADIPTILNRIKSIEADRRSRGHPTTGGKSNRNNRVNEKVIRCYICNETGHTKDKF